MKVDLNPHIEQTSPNGHPFRVSAIRLIKRSWNSYDTHVLIKKDDDNMQILVLDKENKPRAVYKHPCVEYETSYGTW